MRTVSGKQRVFVDHYKVLKVATHVDTAAIKKAFRKLALVHHPDYAGGDGLAFLSIYNAYKILSNAESRQKYDLQRKQLLQPVRKAAVRIPASRLIFPGNVAALARRGLLRRELRSRDRKFYLRINYDVELPLSARELLQPIQVSIPVIVRSVCPECRGSSPYCLVCSGRGSRKSSRLIQLLLEGGLMNGQILEVKLQGLRPEPFMHYKKKKLRIKISCRDSK